MTEYLGNGWVAVNDSICKASAARDRVAAIRADGDSWSMFLFSFSGPFDNGNLIAENRGPLADMIAAGDEAIQS